MKLSALIIAASAVLAPMQAYASTGSDQNSVQAPKAQTQPQVAWDDGDQCDGFINVCVDVDL